MKWFFNLKTSVKLISSFFVISLLLAFVGVYGLMTLSKVNDSLTDMYNNNLLPVTTLSETQIFYQRMRINLRDMHDTDNDAERADLAEKGKVFRKEIETRMDAYRKAFKEPDEIEASQKLDPAWQAYQNAADQGLQFIYAGKDSEYNASLKSGDMRKKGDELNTVLQQLIDINIKSAETAHKAGSVLYRSSRLITLSVIIISVLISVGFGYLISQVIARPLKKMVELVSKVAEGDLTQKAQTDTKDEIGLLGNSMDTMVMNLRRTIGSVTASSESLAAAAQQISATTEEIAYGSTSQANAAQTINELFKELSVAINSVARNAEQASDLANSTMETAQNGTVIVHSSIEGMNQVNIQMSKLEEDSDKIGEIIEVIDDIADQTNLLALNAAIEAARAGEQGRGFAVVADEVRKLAERSSDATKQITSIIKGMQKNTQQTIQAVGEGAISSQQSGYAFKNIVDLVNETANKAGEIAAACEEQAAQTIEVMLSIESIAATSEEAAASSQETAATAQALAHLAEELNNNIAIFKV